MAPTFAILTSDPNLLRCQVDLLKARLRPMGEPRPRSVGLGYVESDRILLRKKPGDRGSLDPGVLVSDVASEVLFFHAGHVGFGAFADEDIMPFRFRRWMFMHSGQLEAPAVVRRKLAEGLPDFLARQLKGTTASEACFLTFVKALRDVGGLDDFDVPASLVGQQLGETLRKVEALEREGGKVGEYGFFVTNGRGLVASRLGASELRYALLEGIARCERCGIDEATPDSNPLLRAHRRVRGVVLATEVADPAGFIDVPPSSTISVGHKLEVEVAALPAR